MRYLAFVHNTFKVQGGTTPYEKCFGVQYHGRLARFGETVMCALATKHIKKGKPRFVKVIWLGKTLSGDLHLCGTSVGVYLSSCIRRLPPDQQWGKDLLKAFRGKPWSYGTAVLGSRLVPGLQDRPPKSAAHEILPLPPILPRIPLPAERVVEKPGDEAASDPPSSNEAADNASGSNTGSQTAVHTGTLAPGESPHPEVTDATMLSELVLESVGESNLGEPAKRAASSLAAPPMFAGEPALRKPRIQRIRVDGEELFDHDEGFIPFDIEDEMDVRVWESEIPDSLGSGVVWADRGEDEGPPELSQDALQEVDRKAEAIEAERLLAMRVLEEALDVPDASLLLQTRYVLDWRYRNGWTRRARLVSKELKLWDPNRTDVFAPSTCPAMSRLVPALVRT